MMMMSRCTKVRRVPVSVSVPVTAEGSALQVAKRRSGYIHPGIICICCACDGVGVPCQKMLRTMVFSRGVLCARRAG